MNSYYYLSILLYIDSILDSFLIITVLCNFRVYGDFFVVTSLKFFFFFNKLVIKNDSKYRDLVHLNCIILKD